MQGVALSVVRTSHGKASAAGCWVLSPSASPGWSVSVGPCRPQPTQGEASEKVPGWSWDKSQREKGWPSPGELSRAESRLAKPLCSVLSCLLE